MTGGRVADDSGACWRAHARLALFVLATIAPGCAAAPRARPVNEAPQVRLQDDDESDVDRSARSNHYDDDEQMRDAPPPFLFPNLRRWLQEDDPEVRVLVQATRPAQLAEQIEEAYDEGASGRRPGREGPATAPARR